MRSNFTVKEIDRVTGLILGRIVNTAEGLGKILGKRSHPQGNGFKRLLLIKFCCMGDAVLITPALRALRLQYKEAEITMFCTSRTFEIFSNCGLVDKIINFDLSGQKGKAEFLKKIIFLWKIMLFLRKQRYDISIDFDNYYSVTTIIAYFAGVPVRIGFNPPGQGRKYFLTHRVPYVGDRHMVEFYLDLAGAAGARTENKTLAVNIQLRDKVFAEKFLQKQGYDNLSPLIAVSAGRSSNWHFIRWGEEKFADVINQLNRKYNAVPVLIGGRAETEIAARITERLESNIVINAVGKISIRQLYALFQCCCLHICNDCGPMHISVASGTPTLAIFGPANHYRWGPYGKSHRVVRKDLPCSPCLFMGQMKGCRSLRCINEIAADEVREATEAMLDEQFISKDHSDLKGGLK